MTNFYDILILIFTTIIDIFTAKYDLIDIKNRFSFLNVSNKSKREHCTIT